MTRIADERERFARQIAGGLRHRALHLPDVVRYARQQLADRIAAEEARRLPEDVAVELVAHVHDDPLPDVFHQVAGEIRPDAL